MRNIFVGAADKGFFALPLDTSGNIITGITSAHITTLGYSRYSGTQQVGTVTSLTPVGLGAITSPHSDGGIFQKTDAYVRVDEPDAAWADNADTVFLEIAGSGVYRWSYEPVSLIRRDVDELTSLHSGIGTFGQQLQPIYYADIKWNYDITNLRDEYVVSWFNGSQILASGSVTNPCITITQTSNGTPVFSHARMGYAGYNVPTLRYNESSSVVDGGEPYTATVSGIIDGSVRTWQKNLSRHKLS